MPARREWMRLLYWVASYYPLYMAAQVWLWVAPAYWLHWLAGAEMGPLRVDPLLVSAGARGGPGAGAWFGQQGMAVAMGVAAWVLLRFARRRWPDVAGRALALVGFVLCGNWLVAVTLRGGLPGRGVWTGVVGVALVVVGVRWAAATVAGGYWTRAGMALAGMAAPAATLPLLLAGGGRAWMIATAAGVMVVGSLLVFRVRTAVGEVRAVSVVAGLVASVLVFGALHEGREWQAAQRAAEVKRVLAGLPKPDEGAPFPKLYFHRGVNFTANGYGYESERARALLRRLPEFEIQSIAVVPYGGMDRRTLRMAPARAGSWESDAGVEIIAATARGLGMKVMLKPHVWRPQGDQPLTEKERERWFREYGTFLEHYARMAKRIHADTFCIGVEFGSLTEDEAQWRGLIARVRAIYAGPLVYAANFGKEFESIRFWDALDYIGLDNYYPLPDDYSAGAIVEKVERVAKQYGKPVLLTEAGYSSAVGAHKTPWADHPPSPVSLEEQVKSYEAIFAGFSGKPWFAGVYWWKIETDGAGGPLDNSMVPWGKPAMGTLKRWYGRPDDFVSGFEEWGGRLR
ncbi:MAG: hypothetical protein J0L64_28315 [Acidobacteria bacterium]|nr:hypothetical protein [Acidobacteriota bacterium]